MTAYRSINGGRRISLNAYLSGTGLMTSVPPFRIDSAESASDQVEMPMRRLPAQDGGRGTGSSMVVSSALKSEFARVSTPSGRISRALTTC